MLASPLPATVNGVPLHPLIVHAVVVLVPLAVLGAIGIAFWPAMRRHLGLLVVLVAVVALISVPLATQSGEDFRARLGAFDLVRQHAHYASRLLPLTAGLVVLLVAMMVLDLARRLGPANTLAGTAPEESFSDDLAPRGGLALATRPQTRIVVANVTRLERRLGRLIPAALRARTVLLARLLPVISVLTIAVAVVLAYYCYKTGDSGAAAVWKGR